MSSLPFTKGNKNLNSQKSQQNMTRTKIIKLTIIVKVPPQPQWVHLIMIFGACTNYGPLIMRHKKSDLSGVYGIYIYIYIYKENKGIQTQEQG